MCGVEFFSVRYNPPQYVVESLFDAVVSFDEAVSVTVPQVEVGFVPRVHVVAQLPGVVKEGSLRVQRKDPDLHRLSVLREDALIQLCSSTQGAGDRRLIAKPFLTKRIIVQVSVPFRLPLSAAAPAVTLHGSYDCWLDQTFIIGGFIINNPSALTTE